MTECSEVAGLHAVVRGCVQGVGFRWFVQRHAAELGLTGWVRNLPDGRVELIAEGPRVALDGLLGQLRRGPRNAWVDAVDARWQAADGHFDGFAILP